MRLVCHSGIITLKTQLVQYSVILRIIIVIKSTENNRNRLI